MENQTTGKMIGQALKEAQKEIEAERLEKRARRTPVMIESDQECLAHDVAEFLEKLPELVKKGDVSATLYFMSECDWHGADLAYALGFVRKNIPTDIAFFEEKTSDPSIQNLVFKAGEVK